MALRTCLPLGLFFALLYACGSSGTNQRTLDSSLLERDASSAGPKEDDAGPADVDAGSSQARDTGASSEGGGGSSQDSGPSIKDAGGDSSGSPSNDAGGSTRADAGAAVSQPDGSVAGLAYRGLSLAGAEFAASNDGTFNGNGYGTIPDSYYYPNTDWPQPDYPGSYAQTAYPYYRAKGFNIFRLPFRWERLQRRLNAEFDASEAMRLKNTVQAMLNAGSFVLLDVHNYARYATEADIQAGRPAQLVGTSAVPIAAFADLWKRLATLYKDNNRVLFGLMNEPWGYNDPNTWREAANAAIAAIRETGAKNLVLVCGNEWGDAGNWERFSGALKDIKDPASNFAFEVHAYPDTEQNGSGNSCPDVKAGSKQLQPFTTWARSHKMKGFLGEFSAGTNIEAESNCLEAVNDQLAHVEQNTDVYLGWTYWAGGQGFGPDNPMEYSVLNKRNSPQMTVLEKHLK
jgi:endoglucanase